MQKSQQGFTLIELVMVIVILGILAATAIPKFVNLQDEARQAAVDGAAGAISSASAINYSTYQVNTAKAVRLNSATSCNDLVTSANSGLVGAQLPSKISIQTEADCSAAAAGDVQVCTLEHDDDNTKTQDANIICTG
jgi:MSHA pilin protein MshA